MCHLAAQDFGLGAAHLQVLKYGLLHDRAAVLQNDLVRLHVANQRCRLDGDLANLAAKYNDRLSDDCLFVVLANHVDSVALLAEVNCVLHASEVVLRISRLVDRECGVVEGLARKRVVKGGFGLDLEQPNFFSQRGDLLALEVLTRLALRLWQRAVIS